MKKVKLERVVPLFSASGAVLLIMLVLVRFRVYAIKGTNKEEVCSLLKRTGDKRDIYFLALVCGISYAVTKSQFYFYAFFSYFHCPPKLPCWTEYLEHDQTRICYVMCSSPLSSSSNVKTRDTSKQNVNGHDSIFYICISCYRKFTSQKLF